MTLERRYILRTNTVGNVPEIEITHAQFQSLVSCRQILHDASDIEQKFDILLANYIEVENTLLAYASYNMVSVEFDYEKAFFENSEMNRKFINLLTTARLYVDHIKHHAKSILGTPCNFNTELAFNTEYDNHFNYRFMEALRNFVQHRGYPVHEIGAASTAKGELGKHRLIFHTEILAARSKLEEDGRFKSTVLRECPDKVDLKRAMRTYIGCLSRVHEKVRDSILFKVDEARAEILASISKYRSLYKKKPVGLSAVEINNNNEVISRTYLMLDWDDIRMKLIRKNRNISNLAARFVSNEIDVSKNNKTY